MPAEKLISSLEELLQLNENLYGLALDKTDILKTNDTEALKSLMIKEQAIVRAIQQAEASRIRLAAGFLARENDLTLSACIEKADASVKPILSSMHEKFTGLMDKLKAANQLNQQLTQQSLQFVSITLNMLIPAEQAPNYSHPEKMAGKEPKRMSLFDSKA